MVILKDEALKMAIEFMETLTIDVGIKTWNEKHRKEAIKACKEALEQPAEVGDAEIKQMLNDIEWYQMRVKELEEELEALEQPRNFCERCGKRASKDPYHIHTCTPPQALEQP